MSATSRLPSVSRVQRYVREAMIDGADEVTVLRGGFRCSRAVTTVRWLVWAKLRAEGYSYPGIGSRFHVDHTTVLLGCRQLASGRIPFDGTGRKARTPKPPPLPKAPKQPKPPKPLKLIRFAGYDPREQQIGCRRGTIQAQREAG